jgi:hypothetical protein
VPSPQLGQHHLHLGIAKAEVSSACACAQSPSAAETPCRIPMSSTLSRRSRRPLASPWRRPHPEERQRTRQGAIPWRGRRSRGRSGPFSTGCRARAIEGRGSGQRNRPARSRRPAGMHRYADGAQIRKANVPRHDAIRFTVHARHRSPRGATTRSSSKRAPASEGKSMRGSNVSQTGDTGFKQVVSRVGTPAGFGSASRGLRHGRFWGGPRSASASVLRPSALSGHSVLSRRLRGAMRRTSHSGAMLNMGFSRFICHGKV